MMEKAEFDPEDKFLNILGKFNMQVALCKQR